MEHKFDHVWKTEDLEAVFRITYTITMSDVYLVGQPSSSVFATLVDVDCIAIKLQDEDGIAWHVEKLGPRLTKQSLARSAEDRFKESESEEAIEALCLKAYERE